MLHCKLANVACKQGCDARLVFDDQFLDVVAEFGGKLRSGEFCAISVVSATL